MLANLAIQVPSVTTPVIFWGIYTALGLLFAGCFAVSLHRASVLEDREECKTGAYVLMSIVSGVCMVGFFVFSGVMGYKLFNAAFVAGAAS